MKFLASMFCFFTLMFIIHLLISLTQLYDKNDYMFTLADGTWICDSYNGNGHDCEHVMSGRKSDTIYLDVDVTVVKVKEGMR